MPDRSNWNVPKEVLAEVVLPPKYKRMSGRSKKAEGRLWEKRSVQAQTVVVVVVKKYIMHVHVLFYQKKK